MAASQVEDSRLSSIRWGRAPWRHQCTATAARTNTATSCRAASAPLSGKKSSTGPPGDLIFKPRGQWHTFWNAGDEPARILEILSPAGFEKFFEKVTGLAERGELNPGTMAALAAEYGTELEFESLPDLISAHGLVFPGGPPAG